MEHLWSFLYKMTLFLRLFNRSIDIILLYTMVAIFYLIIKQLHTLWNSCTKYTEDAFILNRTNEIWTPFWLAQFHMWEIHNDLHIHDCVQNILNCWCWLFIRAIFSLHLSMDFQVNNKTMILVCMVRSNANANVCCLCLRLKINCQWCNNSCQSKAFRAQRCVSMHCTWNHGQPNLRSYIAISLLFLMQCIQKSFLQIMFKFMI